MHSSQQSVSAPRPMAQDMDRPPTRASNSDHPEHLVHVRSRSTAHAQSPKRLSVFSGRSRSNTTTSTTTSATSSRRSPTSSMTSSDAASLPSTHEERTGPTANLRHERQESVTKSLFLRGSRILRRQGSRFNIVATLDEEDELERDKSRFDTDIFARRRESRKHDSHEQMKRMISEPFDFHHLTHTSPSQFQEMDKTRQTDLVTEFSAIRASQKPVANLKGIRADDLHFRDFSTEDLTQSISAQDTGYQSPNSPPSSPGRSSSVSPKQTKAQRDSRPFENFSRPVSRYPRADSISAPPRAASPRLASSPELPEPSPRVIDEILGLSSQQTYPEHVYSTDDDFERGSSLSNLNIEGMFQSAPSHAITTGSRSEPLDARTTIPLTSPSSDLEDVPEEDEQVTHWNDSPPSRSEYDGIKYSPSRFSPLPLQPTEPQSIPKMAPKSQLSIHVATELSKKFSEALGSPTLPQYRAPQETPNDSQRSEPAVRRQSSVSRRPIHETIYESWDDDIDYCYEHAAESNSNFDWARKSLDEPERVDMEVIVTSSDLQAPLAHPATKQVHHQMHLRTSILSTPELDPSPSRSAVSSRSAITPSTAGYEAEMVSQRGGDYFQPVTSSVFPSTLSKHIIPDSLYEEYLTADAESDRHFSFCSQGVIQTMEQPVSPRSSFSPISKCNSQESLILSRAASIVRKHRSSVSTTSVPELVHSLASSRDFSATEPALSGEHPVLGRPDSASHHRQTKSLAREIEAQVMYRTGGNGSTESTRLAASGVHDRAKSASDVGTAPLPSALIKPELPMKSIHRRKGRTSYSLFPTPPTTTPTSS